MVLECQTPPCSLPSLCLLLGHRGKGAGDSQDLGPCPAGEAEENQGVTGLCSSGCRGGLYTELGLLQEALADHRPQWSLILRILRPLNLELNPSKYKIEFKNPVPKGNGNEPMQSESGAGALRRRWGHCRTSPQSSWGEGGCHGGVGRAQGWHTQLSQFNRSLPPLDTSERRQ